MNGHIEKKWARVPKAWEDPPIFQGSTPNEEKQTLASYEMNQDTETRALCKPESQGSPLSYEEDMEKVEDSVSVNPPVSLKQTNQILSKEQTMPLPHFVSALKNLLEVAPQILHREEQEMEVDWAEARDKSLRVLEEGLATLLNDVAKSLVNILDSLDQSQHLRRRAREAERQSEKERWRKTHSETDKWMKQWVERWGRGRGLPVMMEEEVEDDEEDIGEMCMEVRQQVQMAMEKTESEREEEITESDNTAAKQEVAVMEVLMDELGGLEEACRRHCKVIQDRMAHLWETIQKNRIVKTENSGLSEQYPSPVAPPALLEPCLMRGRRPLLPPISP